MPNINNNLYPPVVDSYMPAFIRTTYCRIYFSLSQYNVKSDIKYVQISIVNQNNNLSAFNETLYPNGIKVADLGVDSYKGGSSIYYVEIQPRELVGGVFELNQFYKIQLRLVSADVKDLTKENGVYKVTASWLTDNQMFFSEWSRVCLIRGIEEPRLYLRGFKDMIPGDEENSEAIFTSEVIDFIGELYFLENNNIEKEHLESYQIKVTNRLDNSLVADSGIIYTNEYHPNEINYTLKQLLDNAIKYKVDITFNTNNGYSQTNTYLFYIIQGTQDVLHARITATPDIEYGRILIEVTATLQEAFLGNIAIRRSSSKDNFLTWEDINISTIAEGEALHFKYYDYTVESGVLYNYAAQQINYRGNRGPIITIQNKVLMTFDDIFLTRNNMQVNIRFNPSISSFKKTLSESKIETIGSKYPYIRRNANIGYRQFPISGLITAFTDERGIFISKDSVFGDNRLEYDLYNDKYDINEYQDFIYEKEFRDVVMNFLYENNVKLFRSTTEGNILVKLMDITFTPNQTLGRMLYTFSATAYEIDKCNFENYNKYGIVEIGEYSSKLEYVFLTLGQLYKQNSDFVYIDEKGKIVRDNNLIGLIAQKHRAFALAGYKNDIHSLRWVRFQFDSKPYLIKSIGDSLIPLEDTDIPDENTMYGYIINIDGQDILVSFRGYYELDDKDMEVEKITFPHAKNHPVTVTIDYLANTTQSLDTSSVAQKYYYFKKVGQLWGSFNYNTSISNSIYLKYYITYDKWYERLVSLDKVTVEADAGAVLYIKDSFEDEYFRHVIGDTGVLEFYDPEAVVTGLTLKGMHLVEGDPQERDELRDTEFFKSGVSVSTISEVKSPKKNYVYHIDSEEKDYIYYRGEWYVFNEDNDVECPVVGLIDYIFEYVRGEF